jgi:tetratricopeptide (TPR) repeat protein
MLAPWRLELVDLAFDSASKMPFHPHIKNRSRAQASVVDASLALGQPQRALTQIQKINNWRSGLGYADLAFWCAQHGQTKDVQSYLDLAEKTASRSEEEGEQDWQRDRIRVRIASTHVLLGQSAEAARIEGGLDGAEIGKVAAVEAAVNGAAVYDQRIRALDAAVAKGDFDQTQNAIQACAELFGRVYGDVDKREELVHKIQTSWGKLPVQLRVETLMRMSEIAAEHENAQESVALLDDAQAAFDGVPWLPQDQVPMMARLATLRHKSGDTMRARAQADAALALYDKQRDGIVDIYRAGALRPLAETYQAMGDAAKALSICKRAVEEGVANPNSRPRCDDLVATCLSMAVHGIAPDAELRARLEQIAKALGDPW